MTHSKLIRASRKTPCLICRSIKWPCSYTADRGLAFCGNEVSEKRSSDGVTWLHFDDSIRQPRPAPKVAPSKPVEHRRAGPDHLHAVYSALLTRLSLSAEHTDGLMDRGLPLSEIEANGYKSTPTEEEGNSTARDLAPLGLSGVPGFYRSHGEWKIVKCLPGFFVPYRDSQSRIWGMMYRLDIPIEKQKYRWLSSAGFSQGTSSGAPLHFARPELLTKAKEVWLTEGALKADIASLYLKAPFIAAGGVTQWGQEFAQHFKARFPHVERLIIAYDRDWRTNPHVRAALERLMEQLKDARLAFVIRTWTEDAKGIDDFCLALFETERREVQVAA